MRYRKVKATPYSQHDKTDLVEKDINQRRMEEGSIGDWSKGQDSFIPYSRAERTEPSAPSGPKALMKEDMPRSINCEIVSKINQSIRYVYSEAEGSRCLCASACHSVDGNAFSGNAASRYVVSGETKPLVSNKTFAEAGETASSYAEGLGSLFSG